MNKYLDYIEKQAGLLSDIIRGGRKVGKRFAEGVTGSKTKELRNQMGKHYKEEAGLREIGLPYSANMHRKRLNRLSGALDKAETNQFKTRAMTGAGMVGGSVLLLNKARKPQNSQ